MSLNTILATTPNTTSGYVLRATGTTIGNSTIQDDGTYVGIGIAPSSSYKLNVSGTFNATGAATFSSTITANDTINSLANGYTTRALYITGNTQPSQITWWDSDDAEQYSLGMAASSGVGRWGLYTSTTSTAINTSTAIPKLSINPNGCTSVSVADNINAFNIYGNSSLTSNYRYVIMTTGATAPDYQAADRGAVVNIGTRGGSPYKSLATEGSAYFALSNGSVGIKTDNPNRLLEISGSNAPTLRLSNSVGNNGIEMLTSATTYSWLIGAQYTLNNVFEITPSTAAGGTTFTTPAFKLRNDGFINTGTLPVSPYNNSTTGRTMVIESGGGLGYTSSTRESKKNIESITDVSWINQLNPVSFNFRIKDSLLNEFTEETYDDKSYGFIADEVEQVNDNFVFYDINEDGTKKLAGVKYESMTAVLVKAIQELNQTIQNQQQQINSLINR